MIYSADDFQKEIEAYHKWLKLPVHIDGLIEDRDRADPMTMLAEMFQFIDMQGDGIAHLQKSASQLAAKVQELTEKYERAVEHSTEMESRYYTSEGKCLDLLKKLRDLADLPQVYIPDDNGQIVCYDYPLDERAYVRAIIKERDEALEELKRLRPL